MTVVNFVRVWVFWLGLGGYWFHEMNEFIIFYVILVYYFFSLIDKLSMADHAKQFYSF